jgi:hypothetical protein
MERRLHKGPSGLVHERMVDVLRQIALRKKIRPVQVLDVADSEYLLPAKGLTFFRVLILYGAALTSYAGVRLFSRR